jgi:hypothetical protein
MFVQYFFCFYVGVAGDRFTFKRDKKWSEDVDRK